MDLETVASLVSLAQSTSNWLAEIGRRLPVSGYLSGDLPFSRDLFSRDLSSRDLRE
jgi:hypothetical protein